MTQYITVGAEDRSEARNGIIKLHGPDAFAGMRAATSTAAQFMAAVGGPAVVDDALRDRMRQLLARVRSGDLADAYLRDAASSGLLIKAARDALAEHPIAAARAALGALGT